MFFIPKIAGLFLIFSKIPFLAILRSRQQLIPSVRVATTLFFRNTQPYDLKHTKTIRRTVWKKRYKNLIGENEQRKMYY